MKKGGTGIQVQVRAQARQGGRKLQSVMTSCAVGSWVIEETYAERWGGWNRSSRGAYEETLLET